VRISATVNQFPYPSAKPVMALSESRAKITSSSAERFRRRRRAVFVHDDSNHEVFAAGIDINGERFVELLAEDGKKDLGG